MANESTLSNFSASPSDNPVYWLRQWRNQIICLYTISTFLAIVGNVINLAVVPKLRNQFSANTKLLFVVLAVIDLLVGVICSSSGITFIVFDLPEILALLITWTCSAFVWSSMWILTIASIDRYIAVTRPLRYHTLFPRRRCAVAIASIVCISFINFGGGLLYSRISGECLPFAGICTSAIHPSFAVYYILPFGAVIITTYANARLLMIAQRQRRRIAVISAMNRIMEGPMSDPGLKGLKTIVTVTLAFYVAWLPGTLASLIPTMLEVQVPPEVTLTVRYLIICNSWWNAIIYWIISPSYRRVALRLLGQIIGRPELSDHTTTDNDVFSTELR
ncbi:beta-1 adrenergic receptor-like [Diadema antillarum]|uniref:beta-1 adrenergic receptor-like n=1 Tax=Diadema antillarum TaxID=105358 RepID=UPI003A8B45E1